MRPSNLFSNKAIAPSAGPRARRRYLNRLAIYWPLLLLLAFMLLVWALFGDRFQPSRQVELVPVVTQRASPEIASGSSPSELPSELNVESATLFQASGWVEPAPLPIRVTALYSGIIDTVHVLEGEAVSKGQLLATFVDEDARLDLQTAQAKLGEAEASQRAALAAQSTLQLEIIAAQASLDELLDEASRLERAGRTVFPERDVVQARLRADTQKSRIQALKARQDELIAMADRSRHVVANAKADYARKQLALDRTRIHSPFDGVIQELYVAPGIKRMVGMDELDSATVAKLYQPDSLQARIDVPLEEAASLFIGQAVRLRSSLFPNREFKGRVTRLEGQADLQRNTLQAKVELLDPDPKLRPEMLCRAAFLAPSVASGSTVLSSSDRIAVYVPEAALLDARDDSAVWVLDASGEHVSKQSVELAGERREGYARVRKGLKPGDRVVVNPPADLDAGQRIRFTEED